MVFNGGTLALIVSLTAGLIYGLGFAGRPPSALRTSVKVMAVGALALFGLSMWLSDATAIQQAADPRFAAFLQSTRWIGGGQINHRGQVCAHAAHMFSPLGHAECHQFHGSVFL
jgi:hypothetical protein